MPESPRFSVTIPAYNAASTLAETVASVQAQTFADWELVIVDDGSTDDTLALAESFASADPRIRVISQENRGSGGAYNTAVRNARAELLVMLSADDLLMPEHLATMDALIADNPDASIFTVGGWYEYDDGSRELQRLHEAWADAGECTLTDLLSACFFNMGAVYRREVFDAVGGFREDIYAEDYPFFLMAMAKGFTHRMAPQPLAVHRRSSAQKSADHLRVRRADLAAVREVLATGLLSAAEQVAARHAVGRLKRNILVRSVLGAVAGPEAAQRIINALRRRPAPGGDAR